MEIWVADGQLPNGSIFDLDQIAVGRKGHSILGEMEHWLMSIETRRIAGPAIHAVHPWNPGSPGKRERHQLLGEDERALLAKIATVVHFVKGDQIYWEGDTAEAVFNLISGVVVAYRAFADGEHVVSFLHPGDLFGLSEEGRYINGTRAGTVVVAHKMPLQAVRHILDNNANLDVDVIIKLCEDLRATQWHALLLTQRRATTRLAIFLDLQERLQVARGEPASEIHLPMDRSSIASYLGITLASLGRAFRTLTSMKVISTRNRQHVKVLDRNAFNRIADVGSSENTNKTRSP
jgi:CRP-like cAMP-binding protein